MLQTQLVIHAPDRPGGTPEIAEFLLAVQRRRIDDDVVMDMVLVNMGTDNKGVIALRQLQCKFPPDLVCFFRRDFAGLKRLPEMVGDHIIRTPVPSGQVRILPLGQKKLRVSNLGITFIAINELPKIRFLRILYIVNDVRYGRGNIPTFSNMQRHQSCGRHAITPLKLK